jgi:hypothetical protein
MGTIKEQQQIALTHYCRLAQETVHPRFTQRDGTYTIRITCNAGHE